MQAEARFCPGCGRELPARSFYCPVCGLATTDVTSPSGLKKRSLSEKSMATIATTVFVVTLLLTSALVFAVPTTAQSSPSYTSLVYNVNMSLSVTTVANGQTNYAFTTNLALPDLTLDRPCTGGYVCSVPYLWGFGNLSGSFTVTDLGDYQSSCSSLSGTYLYVSGGNTGPSSTKLWWGDTANWQYNAAGSDCSGLENEGFSQEGDLAALLTDCFGGSSYGYTNQGCYEFPIGGGSNTVASGSDTSYYSSVSGTAQLTLVSSTTATYSTNSSAPAHLSLSPTSGPAGSVVRVAGSGFSASAQVSVAFDGALSATTDSAGDGTFAAQVMIPDSASAGDHTISATDSSGITASAPFLVTETSTTTKSSTATSTIATTTTSTTTTTNTTTSESCYLTEGLAPAAPTTGVTNIYLDLSVEGTISAGHYSAAFNARTPGGITNVGFLFNPVTMYGPTLDVLMDVATDHAADATYTVPVNAVVTDTASGNVVCQASVNADFTVSSITVFTTTAGNQPATAVWPPGVQSPILVTGQIPASQFVNWDPTLNQNGQVVSLAFTVAGPKGNAQATLTLPKADFPPGLKPVLTENGQPVVGQVLTEDASNFYLNFDPASSIYIFDVQLQAQQTTISTSAQASTSSSQATSGNGGIGALAYLAIPLVIVLALVAVFLSRRKPTPRFSERRTSLAGGTAAKFCTNCGRALEAGAGFCTECGTRID